ncbi:hypothetical protein PDE_01541 [Penicillium oxalicum 114-2]|nr:hypothetical protein PDE_01541 [Penicillium oxalicum 114-2]
MAAWVVG